MIEPVLFTDGSVNTKKNVGFGAYLLVEKDDLVAEIIKQKVFLIL